MARLWSHRRRALLSAVAARHRPVVRIAQCFIAIFISTLMVGLEDRSNLVWAANGLLLSYLLLAPRWRWKRYFTAGLLAMLAGGLAVRPAHWSTSVPLTILNITEVAIAAFLLRRRSTELPCFTDQRYLLRFASFAVIAAPAIVGSLFALICRFWFHMSPWRPLFTWITTDGLGTAIVTPACVSLFRSQLKTEHPRWHWLLITMIPVTILSFSQTLVPVIFLIYPIVGLILFRFGLGWASVSTLFVATIGSLFTLLGLGPFAKLAAAFPVEPTVLLQLYIASGMFLVFTAASVLDTLRDTERKLREIVSLHHLVTENSRDVIILADFSGRRSYVSASAARWGEWKRDELLGMSSLDLIHAEDRARAEGIVRNLRQGGEGGLLECRVQNKAGNYLWVEANLRPVRDPTTGAPIGILNMVRDIGERKRAQQSRDFHLSLIAAIHDVSLDGILVVNGEGKVMSYNQRFSDVWKIECPEIPASLIESTCLDKKLDDAWLLSQCVNRTKDPEAFLGRVAELYADPDANDHCQVELNDGRTLERYTTGLRNQCGDYLGRVWFFRDITQRKTAEMELRNAYSSLEQLVVTDALTHLANRRSFDQGLANEWRRGMREHLPLSLLVLDVDRFKSYNDTYGHPRGDSCLKQIAESALDVVTRNGDLVARIGGEEFAVILPNTPNEGALEVAEHICASLQRRRLPHNTNPVGYVTISIGCATMIPSLGQHSTMLMQRADEALYAAKHAGRNQVANACEDYAVEKELQAS